MVFKVVDMETVKKATTGRRRGSKRHREGVAALRALKPGEALAIPLTEKLSQKVRSWWWGKARKIASDEGVVYRDTFVGKTSDDGKTFFMQRKEQEQK